MSGTCANCGNPTEGGVQALGKSYHKVLFPLKKNEWKMLMRGRSSKLTSTVLIPSQECFKCCKCNKRLFTFGKLFELNGMISII
jgi:hypothetical protein